MPFSLCDCFLRLQGCSDPRFTQTKKWINFNGWNKRREGERARKQNLSWRWQHFLLFFHSHHSPSSPWSQLSEKYNTSHLLKKGKGHSIKHLTQQKIYIYIYREREREREVAFSFTDYTLTKRSEKGWQLARFREYLHWFSFASCAGDSAKVGEVIKSSHCCFSLSESKPARERDIWYRLRESIGVFI